MLKKIQNLKWYYKTIILFVLCLVLCFISINQTHALMKSEVAPIGTDLFEQFEAYYSGFDKERYSHIICKTTTYTVSGTDSISCYAIYNGDYEDSLVFKTTTGYWLTNSGINTSYPYFQMNISTTGGYASHYLLYAHCDTSYCYYTAPGNTSSYPKNEWTNLSISSQTATGRTEPYFFYYNFNPVDIYNNNLTNNITFTSGGVSPFSINTFTTDYFESVGIYINLAPLTTYNPNLLANNSSYHKVCVGYDNMFTILSDTGNVDDFMLYNAPLYGLNEYVWNSIDGVETFNPVSNSINNLIFEQPSSLTSFLLSPTNVNNLSQAGYTSTINNYYGWSFYHYDNTFTDTDNFTFTAYKLIDVFSYKPNCIEIDVGGNIECVYDPDNYFSNEVIINYNNEYCFYIPTSYNLHIFETNEFGDIEDTLTINGTDYDINSYRFYLDYLEFSDDDSYKSAINTLLGFLRSAITPVAFINSKINLLYVSLPEPLKLFIYSFIVVLMLIILIKLVSGKH